MKVIFLDVDGVLNSIPTIRRFGPDFIDPVLVTLIAWIVRETGAEIVLSSSWRLDAKDTELVKSALAAEKLSIIDVTPHHSAPMKWIPRSQEIMEWIEKCGKVEKFAIIDDDNSAEIFGNFFQTDENRGITVDIAEKVINFLGVKSSGTETINGLPRHF